MPITGPMCLLIALWVVLAGCSAAPPKPAKHADDSGMQDEATSAPASMLVTHQEGEEGSGADDHGEDGREGSAPKPARADDVDYNVTYQDCRALARVYGGAWLSEELQKLNAAKLKKAQFEKAEARIRKDADETREQWLSQCEGIVDTPYPFSRLKCALKARSVKRFDDCWDGKAE